MLYPLWQKSERERSRARDYICISELFYLLIFVAGIDAGLKEMQERKRSGKRAKHLEELINEL